MGYAQRIPERFYKLLLQKNLAAMPSAEVPTWSARNSHMLRGRFGQDYQDARKVLLRQNQRNPTLKPGGKQKQDPPQAPAGLTQPPNSAEITTNTNTNTER